MGTTNETRIDRIKRRRFAAWMRWERLNAQYRGSPAYVVGSERLETLRNAFDWIMIWDAAFHREVTTVKRARSVGE